MSRITEGEARGLMDAYRSIYEGYGEKNAEVLDEDLIGDVLSNRGKIKSAATRAITATNRAASATNKALGSAVSDTAKQARTGVRQTAKDVAKGFQYGGATGAATALGANIVRGIATSGQPSTPAAPTRTPGAKPPGGTPPGAKPPAAKVPPASTTVLAKQGGVEGKLDKSTGKFTAGAFTGAEKTRYDARAPKPATPAAKPSSYNPLMQKTFGYQTGAAPDQVKGSSAFNKPEIQTPKPAAPVSTTAGFQRPSATPSGSSAFKPETTAVATKPDTGVVKPTAEIAKKPVQPAVAPTPTQMRQGTFREEVDAYDLILDYLLENGHADTVDEAHYVMLEMDSEMIQDIVEEVLNEKLRERPKGLPYGPVGKKFRQLTVPQRAEMIKRGKEHTKAAMGSGEEYSGSHAKSSAIDSALRSKRLGGRG